MRIDPLLALTQNKTSCLTTAFLKSLTRACILLSFVYLMSETTGQKKLRLTKERLVNELRHRTANRVSELREQEGNIY